jgi:WD40 repeat protein
MGQQISTHLENHADSVLGVAFSPDGQTLASGSDDDTIILWNLSTRQPIATLQGHTDDVNTVAFSPDGQTLASGGCAQYDEDLFCNVGAIILWDVGTGQPITTLKGISSAILSVAFSPDGQTLALGDQLGFISLWNVATGEQRALLADHYGSVTSVAFSLDGQTLASSGVDGTIILWDGVSGKSIGMPLSGNVPPLISVTFSPDGQTLASGGDDGSVILWDIATGLPYDTTMAGHTSAVPSVAFSLDGQTLASSSVDGTIILWNMDWHAHACRAAGRNLTAEEWQRYLPDRPYELTCPDLPPHPSAVEAGVIK